MKKSVLKILSVLTIFLLTLSFNKVNAWENGGSIGGIPSSGSGSDYSKNGKFYRVTNTTGYRVTLVKYVKGSNNPQDIASKTYISDVNISKQKVYLETSGHGTLYYTPDGGSKATLIKNGNKISWKTTDAYSTIFGTNSTNLMKKSQTYSWSSDSDDNYVLNYYKKLKDSSSDTVVKYISDEFGIDINNYEKLGCDQLVYYYILVEPMQIIEKNTNNENYEAYFGTVSELNSKISDSRMSTYIFTPSTNFKMSDGTDLSFDYFGNGVGNSPSATTNIADKNGYGVGVIWIGEKLKDACKKCYTATLTGGGGMTCKNIDKNNETEFKEIYEKTDCDKATKEEETNTEDGKLIKEGTNCNLYCAESAFASFPGGFTSESEYGKLFQGAAFEWPKRYTASNFNMYMRSELTCRVVAKSGKTCTNEEANSLKDSAESYLDNLKYGANLTAGTNREINEALSVVKTVKSDNSFNLEVNNGKTRPFFIYKKAYLQINEKVNRIYDIATGKVYDGTVAGVGQYNRGAGFVSHGMNDDVSKTYDLKISNVQLGSGNQFGKKITDYVCHYNILSPDKCNCPDDTVNYCYPGLDLQKYIDAGYTCLEAQEKFCHCSGYYCKHTKDTGKTEITECVNKEYKNGTKIEDAITLCSARVPECTHYECTTDSNEDITDCVHQLAPGKNEVENKTEIRDAIDKCTEKKQKEENKCIGNSCSIRIKICEETTGQSYYSCAIEEDCCEDAAKKCVQETDKDYNECYIKYCDDDDHKHYCQKYNCHSSNKKDCQIDITDCMHVEKKSYETCKKEKSDCNWDICENPPCYTCKATDGSGDIPIDDCVSEANVKQSMTINEAIRYCTSITPECGGKKTCVKGCKWSSKVEGRTTIYTKTCSDTTEICDEIRIPYCRDNQCQRIVYRVIDLNNPFPGKNGNGVTSDFSNGGTGRYPNANWNYVETVKREILQARGATGDELYKLKPLYTIILTPDNIRKIKSSNNGYNNDNKYSDFTLNCTSIDGHNACISSFLHSGEYVKIDTNNSVCGNITNAEEFRACYERIN